MKDDAPGPPVLVVGVDLVDIARVDRLVGRHPERFARRYFTDQERRDCGGNAARLAARWAAKEAAAKALGTGFGSVRAREIEVRCDPRGRPALLLHGAAARHAADAGLHAWSVSLSHAAGHAVAVVAGVGPPRR